MSAEFDDSHEEWIYERREREPEFHGGECPFCHKEAWYCDNQFVECLECGKKADDLQEEMR